MSPGSSQGLWMWDGLMEVGSQPVFHHTSKAHDCCHARKVHWAVFRPGRFLTKKKTRGSAFSGVQKCLKIRPDSTGRFLIPESRFLNSRFWFLISRSRFLISRFWLLIWRKNRDFCIKIAILTIFGHFGHFWTLRAEGAGKFFSRFRRFWVQGGSAFFSKKKLGDSLKNVLEPFIPSDSILENKTDAKSKINAKPRN